MFDLIRQTVAALRRRREMARYDDFTIAEYFREQGAQVGEHCRIMIRSFGSEPFLIRIGNHCTIAPEASLVTHDGAGWLFTDSDPSLQRFGRIAIGDNCFIGLRSTLMPGVSIGANSIIGACALVTRDVPSGVVVAGNPARVICSVADYRSRVEAAWQRQRPNGYMRDVSPGAAMTPTQIHALKVRDLPLLRAHLQAVL